MGIYRVGPPSGYLKSFVLSFLFLIFYRFSFFFPSSILHFPFSSLSGAPLAPGPLDIVHPCHPIATPLYSKQEGKKITDTLKLWFIIVTTVFWEWLLNHTPFHNSNKIISNLRQQHLLEIWKKIIICTIYCYDYILWKSKDQNNLWKTTILHQNDEWPSISDDVQ